MRAAISLCVISLVVLMAATQSPKKTAIPALKTNQDLNFSKAKLKAPPKELVKEMAVMKQNIKELEVIKKEILSHPKVTQQEVVANKTDSVVVKFDSVYNVKKKTWIKRVLKID